MAPKQKQLLPRRVRGFLSLSCSLLLFLSLASFSKGEPHANFLGFAGYGLSLASLYLLGFSAYFLPLFLSWIGYVLLFQSSEKKVLVKILLFLATLFSLSLLLAFLPTPYLGGVPFDYLCHKACVPFLGTLGTVLIFTSALCTCAALLIKHPLTLAFEWIKSFQPKPREVQISEKPSIEDEIPLSPSPRKRVEMALEKKMPEPKLAARKTFSHYTLPPPSLLTPARRSEQKNDLRPLAKVLEETLQSFGIEAKVSSIQCGPTIASFEVQPSVGVKVQKIKALENDIALNMQARSLRIIAPIPGKAAVGIEVPNPTPQEVGFKELLESYLKSDKKMAIPLLLGKGVSGEDIWADLSKMPHLIIAGATGSGKSVCINTIVMSILATAHPSEIKLLMVDPKKVELSAYSPLPHMLAPVITEAQEAHGAFIWLVREMERRYEIFRRLGIRNISLFNERKIDEAKEATLGIDIPKEMPYIVAIVDELADLMMVSANDIETPIARIAQMARAVGIHLILATQRPSREVITGLIKANFPTRIAFKVSSRVNSQIVLDDNGAETLLGNGDMLFMPPGTSALMRGQGAYIRDEDITSVIEFICKQLPTQYIIPSFKDYKVEAREASAADEEGDALYTEAKGIIFETGNASTTFLQRKLKIGYARAASLMDQLEGNGIIGPQEGAKPRKIFYPENKEI